MEPDPSASEQTSDRSIPGSAETIVSLVPPGSACNPGTAQLSVPRHGQGELGSAPAHLHQHGEVLRKSAEEREVRGDQALDAEHSSGARIRLHSRNYRDDRQPLEIGPDVAVAAADYSVHGECYADRRRNRADVLPLPTRPTIAE